MKTTIKILIVTIIIITGFLSSCKKDLPPYQCYYIPDSLRFHQKTGDTTIFQCITNDTVVYDTFYIKVCSEMEVILDHISSDNYGIQSVGTYETNDVFYLHTSQDYCYRMQYSAYKKNFRFSMSNCHSASLEKIKKITINNTDYYNVLYIDEIKCNNDTILPKYNIYINLKNGLLSYTTEDSLTYNPYKYISLNDTTK